MGPKPLQRKRLVILGAGFGGLYTVKALESMIRPEDNLEISLINDENYFLYTPLLSEVAAGSVETRHILTSLRELVKKAQFIRAKVDRIEMCDQYVLINWGGEQRRIYYDYLVIALGSTTNKTMVPGAAQHAISLKEVSDALLLRNRVFEMFEETVLEGNPDVRKAMLTFTVVGGGFSGVEVAGAINELTHKIKRFYPHVKPEEVRVVVVEGQSRILAELPEDLAEYSLKVLRETGVEVILGHFMTEVTSEGVTLKDGTYIPSRTVVWTTGVAMDPLVANLPCSRSPRHKIQVNEYLEAEGYEGQVWSLGDCAQIPDLNNPGKFVPPTAQYALREATVTAKNILAAVRGQQKQPFRYKSQGELVALGGHYGAGNVKGIPVRGFVGWVLWRGFYLLRLPSWPKKIRVGLDWMIDLFTPRDTTQVKLVPTALLEAEKLMEASVRDVTTVSSLPKN
jgi:NADH dehydrogenase